MAPTLDQPELVHGDSLDALLELEPASIDAIVHDPPAGIGFMGREWDDKRGYKPRTDRGRQVLDGLELLGLEPWASGFASFMTEVFVAELRVVKPGAHSLTWALPRTSDLTMLALRLAGWEVRDSLVHLFGGGFPKSGDLGKQDPCASGWATTIAPGHEQWILARRDPETTAIQCFRDNGCGALNVSGCAIPRGVRGIKVSAARKSMTFTFQSSGTKHVAYAAQDSWPKSVLISSHEIASEIDSMGRTNQTEERWEGAGGVSRYFTRFFYAPRPTDRSIPGRPDLTNKHPTVKSVDLCRWLVRLITPPGGVVLDDFMGSGTTGVAAVAEGCRFIGIEREGEHFDVARVRILAAVGSPDYAAEANAVAPVGAQLGLL